MGLGCENDRKRLAAGTSVPARGGFEAVSHPKPIKVTSVHEFTS
jgi:hypothetical protein